MTSKSPRDNELYIWSIKEGRCVVAPADNTLITTPSHSETELIQRAELSAPDIARLEQLKSEARRLEYLITRVIIRERFGSSIGYHSNGQPFLDTTTPSGHISISHTQGYVAVSASTNICGVDIEPIARCAVGVAIRFSTLREVEIAARAFPLNPELLIWCAKETVFKIINLTDVNFVGDITVTDIDGNQITASCPRFGNRTLYLRYFVYDDELLVVTAQLA